MKLVTTLLLINAFALISACSGTSPKNLGYINHQFIPCPSSPNCVSSFATSDSHKIKAINFNTPPESAFQFLHDKLAETKRVQIVKADFPYLYAEFESSLLGFVDDVEFYFSNNKIDVRSASRIGYSDLGVNRKRIETIRQMLNQIQ